MIAALARHTPAPAPANSPPMASLATRRDEAIPSGLQTTLLYVSSLPLSPGIPCCLLQISNLCALGRASLGQYDRPIFSSSP